MILFIWLNYYARSNYEMTFLKKMHSDQTAKDYGLFYFLSKLLYTVLHFLSFDMNNWEKTREYHKMQKVVIKLIDILYLYKRIEFIERALEVLFDEHQLKVLHLMRNKTFKEAEKNCGRY